MNKDELEAMKMLAKAVVERIDNMGKGREMIDILGPEKFKALMELTRDE